MGMKPKHRRAEITDILLHEGRVSVEWLASKFNTSVETIRRDLGVLSNAGKLQRTHGGAILASGKGEGSFRQRMGENVAAKRLIAQKASALVSPGDTLFVDAGSTTLMLAEELAYVDQLTIITNSAQIAKILGGQNSTRLFLIGGAYNAENSASYGQMAISQLSGFRANFAFSTVGAIDKTGGAMNFDLDEAELARSMFARAEKTVVLADESKFNSVAPFEVSPFSGIDLMVSDCLPDETLQEVLRAESVKIVC